MDIKQLHYFVTIIEEGNITKAAARLHISQPPLSTQMRLLEEELGITLMERGARKITLTAAGHLLYSHAKNILSLTDTAQNELKQLASHGTEVLHLGTISTTSSIILDPRLMTYHKKNPHVRIDIHEGNSSELFGWLNTGIIDLALTRTPVTDDLYHSFYIGDPEPMIALMKKDMDWCPERNQISLEELVDRPLVYHRRYRSLVETECEKYGFAPYCISVSNVRNSVLWASSGMGIALVPQTAASLASSTNMVSKQLNFPMSYSQQCILWHKHHPLTHAAKKLLYTLGYRKNL